MHQGTGKLLNPGLQTHLFSILKPNHNISVLFNVVTVLCFVF